jgi:hypothetical protein
MIDAEILAVLKEILACQRETLKVLSELAVVEEAEFVNLFHAGDTVVHLDDEYATPMTVEEPRGVYTTCIWYEEDGSAQRDMYETRKLALSAPSGSSEPPILS